MYDSVMVDLETMGTGERSAIVSIGAFKFELGIVQKLEEIVEDQKFYRPINLKSAVVNGGRMDSDTVMWWMEQEDAARKALKGGDDIVKVLTELSGFIGSDKMLWGNGATFDNVILRNAFSMCKVKYPVRYKNDMCFRTARKLLGDGYESVGTKHHALDDAITQGLHIQKIYAKVKGMTNRMEVI